MGLGELDWVTPRAPSLPLSDNELSARNKFLGPGDSAPVPNNLCSFESVEYPMMSRKALENLQSFVQRCYSRMGEDADLQFTQNLNDLLGAHIIARRNNTFLVTRGYPYMVGNKEVWDEFTLVTTERETAKAFGFIL
jgi:hypothetical protein